jgi:plasmid maintenance system killer protein
MSEKTKKVKCNFCGSEQYEERRIEYLYSYKGKDLYVDLATRLDDLRVPPGNRLHALKGDRKGQYSIAIND